MYNQSNYPNVDIGSSENYYSTDNYSYNSDTVITNENMIDQSYEHDDSNDRLWVENCSLNYNNRSVLVLKYDSDMEMLWSGYDDGRVSSFVMRSETSNIEVSYEVLQSYRYSSFLTNELNEPVIQLIPLRSYIVSVCLSSIRIHTIGGLPLGKICNAPTIMPDIHLLNDDSIMYATFTCAVGIRPSQSLVTADNVGPTHIIAGTSYNTSYAFDINIMNGNPLIEYDIGSPAVIVQASDTHIAIACFDGKIRFLDTRLRNSTILYVLEAHSGPIRDICLHPDGVTILTCGLIGRPINPYDPKSPVNYVSDPLVKVRKRRDRGVGVCVYM